MILWIFGLILLSVLALVGFYQGAVRVAFSLAGLLLAAVLAMPLAFLVKPVLPVLGIKHPVLLAFIAPVLVYLLILILFKSVAAVMHKKVETHYKYQASDTKRLLWERLNQRLGLCLGLANGAVYLFLLSLVAYLIGYFTFQVATSDQDSIMLKMVNRINKDLNKTGMLKVVVPFSPASAFYYDAADILGFIYHNPLLQSRLSSYPPFLPLAEKPEFQAIAKDTAFQDQWLRQARFAEFRKHERIKPLVKSPALYKEVVSLVDGDLKDLKGYLETGKSEKFDHEKILGRWNFNFQESVALARKNKPSMASAELRRVRTILRTTVADATLTATIDKRVLLKVPSANETPQVTHGTWRKGAGVDYFLTLIDSGKNVELETAIESNRLIFVKEGIPHVFMK